ncbi:MAG TPA: lytic transglycosylase domain-containing protein [Thermoanaerobaculia bacterium]|nr:lytic transglycosylase domain-containing protein [Thermoanaerobaculia bacterium]
MLLGVSQAGAQVSVRVGEDGRRVITNENSVQRSRRLSPKLLPIPDINLEPLIQRHSTAQQLDPKLVQALIQVESGYNHRALSRKGAMGLMQLMPSTASLLGVSDPYDPDQNVRGGTTYLRRMIDKFQGRLEWAVAAYNAGPGAVERHRGIPPYRETRDYVQRVLSLFQGNSLRVPVLASSNRGFPASTRKPYIVRRNGRLVLTTSLSEMR